MELRRSRERPGVLRGAPLLEFSDVVRTFAQWVVEQKRRHRPEGLYVVGVNGAVGQGKTVFSRALVSELRPLLKLNEGQALTRSLDDYYLPKSDRYRPKFLARGYHPPDIPNRGPAGTHDVQRLISDLKAMEASTMASEIELPAFDKQTDDRAPDPFVVSGRVGVFVFEGWFVGNRTQVDSERDDPGLRRSVAEALPAYERVFNRLDALWVFEPPPSFEDIVTLRLEQQATLDRETGLKGMIPSQIRRFIEYFYKDAWQPGVTTPTPLPETADFWAKTDLRHRFMSVVPCP